MATVTVRSSGGDYSSLQAALTGEAGTLSAPLTIDCAGFADTYTSTVNGGSWGLTASNYLEIKGTDPKGSRLGFDTGRYYLDLSNAAVAVDLSGAGDFVRVIDLQFKNARETTLEVDSNNTDSDIRVTGCVFWGTGICSRQIQLSKHQGPVYVVNCLFYDDPSNSVIDSTLYANENKATSSSNLFVYNCGFFYGNASVENRILRFRDGASSAFFKNCWIYDANTSNTQYRESTNGTLTIVTSFMTAASSSDLPFTTGTTITFEDISNGDPTLDDFRLASGDASLLDGGTDLSSDSDFSFSVDFFGSTRSGTWDVGPHELVPSGTPAKIWNGSSWITGTPKVWNGSTWVAGTPKVWDGSAWV